jgi:hypothetical protein
LKRMIVIFGALAALLAAVAVASAARGHRSAALPVVQISETGGTVQWTGTPQSGATELDFTTDLPATNGNTGATIGVIRLKNGVTPEQFEAGIKPDGSNLAKFGSLETTADLSKGQTLRIQTILKPAQYVIADLNAPPSSNRHTVVTVAQNASPAALPSADATVRMKEYRFTGPATLRRGEMVRTVNAGKQQHMAIALKVKNGKVARQVEALLRKGKDKRAQKLLKGVGNLIDDVSPGAVNQSKLTLARGTWVLACFMTNRKGVEHTRLGMERTLVVK